MKSHFGSILAPFGPSSFSLNIRLHVFATSCKKSENSKFWFFIKLEKPHFRPILSTFGLKSAEKNFFSKNSSSNFLFKLDDTLTLCKKSENSNKRFWRKTRDKQANRQITGEYFIGPSLHESNIYKSITAWNWIFIK